MFDYTGMRQVDQNKTHNLVILLQLPKLCLMNFQNVKLQELGIEMLQQTSHQITKIKITRYPK